jgi:hypothetical protein
MKEISKPRCNACIWLSVMLCSIFLKPVNSKNEGFLATFPTSVIPGGKAQFCIRFFNLNEDVVLKIRDDEPSLFEPILETIASSKTFLYFNSPSLLILFKHKKHV